MTLTVHALRLQARKLSFQIRRGRLSFRGFVRVLSISLAKHHLDGLHALLFTLR